jgi:hypothetical protein
MKHHRIAAVLLLLTAPGSLLAQEAHSFGIGMATTAAPMEIFGLYWNPAHLAMPVGGDPPPSWTIGSGYSIFDTSNADSPIMQFTPENAHKSSRNPVERLQQQTGIFGVKYLSAGGGMLYEQRLNFHSSQGALSFFHDRDNNSLTDSAYLLDYRKTTQQVGTLMVSYATPIPLGGFPFFAIGGSLKYHKGFQFEREDMTGFYQKSGATTDYQYNKFSSTSGLGFSMDTGLLARISEIMQVGMMFQNFQSTFNWEAQKQSMTLDPATGLETAGGSSAVTVSAPMPYAVRFGVMFAPQEKNTLMEGEVEWVNHETNWRFGLERYYPEASMVVRLGTFFDQVSKSQLWCFGGGYERTNFNVDLSFFTRSLPDLTGSIALGGALSAAVRF